MKIVSIGANSFIAKHLPYQNSQWRFLPDEENIRQFLDTEKPDVIVNCLGKTGNPNIDWCETHREETHTANVTMPTLLVQECDKRCIKLIHIGSGCLYYATSPHFTTERWSELAEDSVPYDVIVDHGWKEDDPIPEPKSYYSKTKDLADRALSMFPDACILRIRMPISSMDHPRNLLTKLIGYRRVIDTQNSVTFMSDFVNAVKFAIEKDLCGIYNLTSPRPITHLTLLDEYVRASKMPGWSMHYWQSIPPDALKTEAPRSNCILDCSKIQAVGFKFEDTYEVMKRTVKEFVANRKANG